MKYEVLPFAYLLNKAVIRTGRESDSPEMASEICRAAVKSQKDENTHKVR